MSKRVWRLMTHHVNPDKALRWSRQNGRIAIGWGYVGDIGKNRFRSPQQISSRITELIHAGVHPHDNAGLGGVSLWNFYAVMTPGDLVILNTKGPSLVMEVTGDYEWVEDEEDLELYQHQREAKVTTWDPRNLWRYAGGEPVPGQSIRCTLIECKNRV